MSATIYNRLTERNTIRLLRVDGWTQDGYLDCSLRNSSVDGADYIALSYVWGSDFPSCKIMVNHRPHWVRPNLWSFLSFVAHTDNIQLFSRSIWIDALCINQADIEEKQQQIPIMGRIFGQASKVVSWLQAPHARPSPTDKASPAHLAHIISRGDTLDQVGDGEFGTVLRLAAHEYWSRAWIVQEVHLAKEVIMFWQQQLLSWDRLQEFVFGGSRVAILAETVEEQILNKAQLIIGNQGPLPVVKPFASLVASAYASRFTHWISRRSLKHLVVSNASQSCTMVFDRVFAFIALSKEPDFAPNYAESWLSLLARVMLASDELPDKETLVRITDFLCSSREEGQIKLPYIDTIERNVWRKSFTKLDFAHLHLQVCPHCVPPNSFSILLAGLPDADVFFGFPRTSQGWGPAVLVFGVEKAAYGPEDHASASQSIASSAFKAHRTLHFDFHILTRRFIGVKHFLLNYDQMLELLTAVHASRWGRARAASSNTFCTGANSCPLPWSSRALTFPAIGAAGTCNSPTEAAEVIRKWWRDIGVEEPNEEDLMLPGS